MHLELEKKVVLVTGGTKGIGRAIVEGFLEEGATVHFCSRTKEDVDKATEELSKKYSNTKAIGATVDAADHAKLKSWVESCAEQSGGIDVVVPNVSALAAMGDTAENWERAFNVDMMHTYHVVQTALPLLEKSKGNIVTISSISGRELDVACPSPYGAMKAALNHYTSQLAHVLAPKGIRANAVSPGNTYFEGGFWGTCKTQMPELFQSQIDLNPTGRMATSQEVANAVVFLASARASFISGTNLLVDGSRCVGVQF